MLTHEEQHSQSPLTIDFLGLGNVSTGDNCEALCFPSSINMKFAGVDPSVEGTVQSQGFTCATRQWQQLPFDCGTTGEPQQTRDLQYAKASGSQLTIFYEGDVNVFNDVSINTVEAIVHMAATGKPLPDSLAVLNRVVGTPVQGFGGNLYLNALIGQTHFEADQASQNCPLPNTSPFNCPTPSLASSPLPMVPKALPLARKASLVRFFEKRRERMQMMKPYMKQQQKQFAHAQFPGTETGFDNGAVFARIHEEFCKKQPIMPARGM